MAQALISWIHERPSVNRNLLNSCKCVVRSSHTKGQLTSEWLFGVINFPKYQPKISALESKEWSNQKGKDTILCWIAPKYQFCRGWFNQFLDSRAEIFQIFALAFWKN